MDREHAAHARRGAADWLVLVGRFASLVYLNVLVWLSLWVLIPTLLLGWRPLAIDSGSMGPSIHAGDVVLVERYRGGPVGAGRVITYEDPAEPGRLVTHRVSGVNDDGTFQTKGDANEDADSTPIPPEQVRGVGRLVVPRVGLPVVWMTLGHHPQLIGWAVTVLVALFLLAPSRPAGQPRTPPQPQPAPRRRQAETAAAGAAAVRVVDRPSLRSAPPAPSPGVPPRVLVLPVAPGTAAPQLQSVAPFALVPAVRYRLRLPRPPMPLTLPAPPRWTVALVPPAPGTAPVAPIPPPPRPAAVRRGSALGTRQVPGWTGRLHSLLLVLVLLAGLGLAGTASAPPAHAAFSSTYHRIVSNTGSSFTADQLAPPTNPNLNAPIAACRIQVSWSESPTTWKDGYRIYRSVNGGAYTLLGTAAATAVFYTDNTATNPSNVYAYRMVAYEAVNWESSATTPVSGSPSVVACST